MKASGADWYKSIWDLSIKNMSWVEDTENQADFIIQTLGLTGTERILDLACGYGRHALTFARRGYAVVGVDITEAYIDDAVATAKKENLSARFILSDIRDVRFDNEFDVVLNLADGAVGYLENDEENLKIFDIAAKALKPGGSHFMDIINAAHAQKYFPKHTWAIGENEFSFAEFEWDPQKKIMLYGGGGFRYGEAAQKPAVPEGNPTRLYFIEELQEIYQQRGMQVLETFSDFYGKPASPGEMQLLVYAKKAEM
ncbi:MAG: class I SAM-dependent methyltransferase [Oscillospiraceae bacterium]|nr:class I SAM-dependent methyltransferase [Oscillospiraceae bacterium]